MTSRATGHDQVLADTQRWFERAVIGLNLCPFAKGVHQKAQIRWLVSDARTRQALAETLAEECLRLVRTDAAVLDTTVLIHPRVLKPFGAYLQFLALADDIVRSLRLEGVLQVASFHPQYRFAELPPGDAGHRSNQSPYPLLHLLREDSVARAVAAFPDAANIYERNIATLRELGDEGWQRLLGPAPRRQKVHRQRP